MLNRLPVTVFVMLLLVLSACRDPPDYPNEPVIEYIGSNKTAMTQGPSIGDFVFLTISFTDGDGDLGSSDFGDSTRVYYADTRLADPIVQSVSIPMVPELGSGNGISGEIRFKVPNSCCFYPPGFPIDCGPLEGFPTDTIVYDIFILDRKENKSNVVQSEPIILLCN
ncbi:MAG: hypothetical protein ACI8YQ_001011 [Polaribacter sp.]|jgi:hypothetical protein